MLVKAALIIIFKLTTDQMTTCNVKGITYSDQPAENYHLIPPKLYTHYFSIIWLIVLVFLQAAGIQSLQLACEHLEPKGEALNATSNECCSVSAGCVKKPLFANTFAV